MLEIDRPFTISPSTVINLVISQTHQFSEADRQMAVEASKRGRAIHKQIEYNLTHHHDNPDIQTRLVSLVRQIAVSASRIIYFEGYRHKLKDAGTIRRKKPDGQLYLFQPDQLSPEYLEARFDLHGLGAEIFEEYRSIFNPALAEFKDICRRIS